MITPRQELDSKTILLVEDDDINRMLTRTILSKHNFKVVTAHNGEEAVKLARESVFDLILMDIRMPFMDGLEATYRIRTFNTLIPIIALTAYAFIQEEERCLEAGMDGYISKPFTEEDLLNKINYYIGTSDKISVKTYTEDSEGNFYSLDNIKSLSAGNKEFVDTMLNMIIEQIPVAVSDMKKAYAGKDLRQVYDIVHKIKPIVLDIQVKDAAAIINRIEALTKDNTDSIELNDAINWLQETLSAVIAHIKSHELGK